MVRLGLDIGSPTLARALALLLPPLMGFASSGCGAASFQDNVYRDGETHYRIGPIDEGWTRIGIGSNDLAFRNDRFQALIQINGQCNPAMDIPLEALTAHLLIGFTDRELVDETRIPLADREALRSHIRASLDGVARELLLFVLKKNDCVYDFALVTPPGQAFARARNAFETMVLGFQTASVN